MFQQAKAKLTIGSLDDTDLEVAAQYNPGQLEVQRQVPWKAPTAHSAPDHRRVESEDNDLEFTGGEGRSLTLELLFDGYEGNKSIEPQIEALDEMATVRLPAAKDEHPRPHQCVVVWGTGPSHRRPMVCVIESIAVKYSVFDSDGRPLRAIATVKVKEGTVTKLDRKKLSLDRPAVDGNAAAWAKRQINLI